MYKNEIVQSKNHKTPRLNEGKEMKKEGRQSSTSLFHSGKKEEKEKISGWVFRSAAFFSLLSLFVIIFFIFKGSAPFLKEYGLLSFISGKKWAPSNRPAEFGILPMITGSVIVTAGSVLIGAPIGVLTAIFLQEYCPPSLSKMLNSAVQLMAAVPSVVYGFFALQVFVPVIRYFFGGTGMTALTAILLLSVMILPTVIGLSKAALQAVPVSYYAGSQALGADQEQTIFQVVLPAAKSGIFSSIILGVGRAIGETMAVVLVTGNQPILPNSLVQGVRTLTTNVVLEMAYATGQHRQALIATASILFLFILSINFLFIYLQSRERKS